MNQVLGGVISESTLNLLLPLLFLPFHFTQGESSVLRIDKDLELTEFRIDR